MARRKINFVVRVVGLDAESSETLGQVRKTYSLEAIQDYPIPSNILGADLLNMINDVSRLIGEETDGPEKV